MSTSQEPPPPPPETVIDWIPNDHHRLEILCLIHNILLQMDANLSGVVNLKPGQFQFLNRLLRSLAKDARGWKDTAEAETTVRLDERGRQHSATNDEDENNGLALRTVSRVDEDAVVESSIPPLVIDESQSSTYPGGATRVVGDAATEEKERRIWMVPKHIKNQAFREQVLQKFNQWRTEVWVCVVAQLGADLNYYTSQSLGTDPILLCEKPWLSIAEVIDRHIQGDKKNAGHKIGRLLRKRGGEGLTTASSLLHHHPSRLDLKSPTSEGLMQNVLNCLLIQIVGSTGGYNAYTSVLLSRLCTQLQLSSRSLLHAEKRIAYVLQATTPDKTLSAKGEQQIRAAKDEFSRRMKVGIASTLGGLLLGLSGGLTAPLLATGVGTLMTGLGVGATVAATSLNAFISSSIVMASLFGTYGGTMAGKMIGRYSQEVREFEFMELTSIGLIEHDGVRKNITLIKREHDSAEELIGSAQTCPETENPDIDRDTPAVAARSDTDRGRTSYNNGQLNGLNHHHLRVTICVSGWLLNEEDVVEPWNCIRLDGTDAFALKWEMDSLIGLGKAMMKIPRSAAWSYARHEVLKRTIFGSVLIGLWPLALVKIGRLMENPFNIAKARSDKAGAILCDVLLNQVQGHRPVILIGFSLGARVIFTCLQHLANKSAVGIIECVVLMGAPVPSDKELWQRARAIVAGRLVNVFSESDWVLALLYRTNGIRLGVAGLQPIKGVPLIENIDASSLIKGHAMYRICVKEILNDLVHLDERAPPEKGDDSGGRIVSDGERCSR